MCIPCPEGCADNKCDNTGRCLAGCEEGFHGDWCTDMCAPHCDGPCDKYHTNLRDGVCMACLAGYTGKMCTKSCHPTCNTCKQYGHAVTANSCTSCPADEASEFEPSTGTCDCIAGASRSRPDAKCHCEEPEDQYK